MKLSIALVTSFLFVLGGAAFAQEPPDVDRVGASVADVANTAGCPVAGNVAADQATYAEQCAGYNQSIDPSPEGATKYACDVAGALLKGIADNGGAEQSAPAVALHVKHCPPAPASPAGNSSGCTANCTSNVMAKADVTGNPPGAGADVLGQSLPRTGAGEAPALIGFALSSLGALVRRFLP